MLLAPLGRGLGLLRGASQYVPRNMPEFGFGADGYPFDEERVECVFLSGGGVLEVVGASEPGPKISLTSYSERKT